MDPSNFLATTPILISLFKQGNHIDSSLSASSKCFCPNILLTKNEGFGASFVHHELSFSNSWGVIYGICMPFMLSETTFSESWAGKLTRF